MSARGREVLALALAALVLLAAVGAAVAARLPDEVDRVTEQVMLRLERGGTPPSASGGGDPGDGASPSPSECATEVVVDDYGVEVPIVECRPR